MSVIGLAQRMDAGEVYARASLAIDPIETAGELHDRLAQLGPDAVLRVLADLGRGQLRPIPQDDALATRAPKLSKADGTVDLAQPADAVRARVHGMTPWPGCRVAWQDAGGAPRGALILGRVRVVETGSAGVAAGTVLEGQRVACEPGVVELLEVQAPGTKMMSAEAFARGHGLAPGDRLTPLTPEDAR